MLNARCRQCRRRTLESGSRTPTSTSSSRAYIGTRKIRSCFGLCPCTQARAGRAAVVFATVSAVIAGRQRHRSGTSTAEHSMRRHSTCRATPESGAERRMLRHRSCFQFLLIGEGQPGLGVLAACVSRALICGAGTGRRAAWPSSSRRASRASSRSRSPSRRAASCSSFSTGLACTAVRPASAGGHAT